MPQVLITKRVEIFKRKLKSCAECTHARNGKLTTEVRHIPLSSESNLRRIKEEIKLTKEYLETRYKGRIPFKDSYLKDRPLELIRFNEKEAVVLYITYRSDLYCTKLKAFICPPEGIANVCPYYCR